MVKRSLGDGDGGAAGVPRKRKTKPPPPSSSSAPSTSASPHASIAEAIPTGGHSKGVGKPDKQPKVIVVLERACLETGKVGKEHVLLNCDDHANFLRKHKRDPAESRPDILHQCMLIQFFQKIYGAHHIYVIIVSSIKHRLSGSCFGS